MKNKNTTIPRTFLKNMVFITLFSFGLVCLFLIYDEYSEFSSESISLRENHIAAQKDNLRENVTEVAHYIQHMKNQTEKKLKKSIRGRVYEALQIAENIYQQNRASKSLEEIKKLIKDTLRSIRFNNGRGYYFAVSMDGVEQMYPVQPELEGKNLIDLQDSHGNFVIRDEINMIKKSKEGFVTDFWPKPDKNPGIAYPKISFVKYFEPLNWYFGTGEYLDNVKMEIQEEVLNYIKDIRFYEDGYFFSSTYHGEPLFSNGHITKGTQSIFDLTDPNGVKIFQEYRKAVQNPDGAFIYYSWPKLNSSVPSPKISFVAPIPDWEWIIGAGSYIDTIEVTIAKNKAALKEGLINRILASLLMLVSILLLYLLWARYISNKIQSGITTFSSFFKKAATRSVTMNPEDLHFPEFSEIATLANKMLTDRTQAEAALRESEEKYRQIFENIQDVYYETSIDGTIIELSPSVEKFFQYKRDALIGKSLYDFYADPQARDKLLERLISNGKVNDYEIYLKDKDGTTKSCSVTALLIKDSQDAPLKFVGSMHDISERKKAEASLRESEEKHRLLFMHSNDVIYSLDPEFKLLTISPSVEKMLGYTPEELIGKSLPDMNILESAYLEQAFLDTTRVLSGETIESSIYAFTTKDGSHKFADVSGAPLYHDNKIIAIISIARDITERRTIEEALKESEQKLRTIIEHSNEMFYIHDTKHILTYASPTSIDILGYTPEEMKIKWTELATDNPVNLKGIKLTEKTIKTGEKQKPYLIELKKKDGTFVFLEIDESPVKTAEGGVIAISGAARDVTKRILTEKHIKELQKEIIQARKMESIGTLSGGIAHDFNNILSIIIGNTELALDDVPESNLAHGNLEEIKSAGLRAKNIVSQLLAFSRKTDQNLKPVAIVPVIKDALAFLRSTIASTIDICADIVDSGETVLADPVQLNQIMMNLCINASHAMEDSGGKLSVNVESSILDNTSAHAHPDLVPGEYIKLTVSDTGPGIDPDIADRIFDPYFTTKGVGKGSGMGLAVVHGIVINHNGAIFLDSSPGKGAVFSILLPKITEKPEIKSKPAMDLPTGSETILFVDDEASIMKLGKRMMERLGYNVDATTSATDALKRFRLTPDMYDLVITDMTMPEMTGVALAEELMRIRADIPIIICTGYSALIDEEKAKTMDIAAFVMKPMTRQKIARIIRQVLDDENCIVKSEK